MNVVHTVFRYADVAKLRLRAGDRVLLVGEHDGDNSIGTVSVDDSPASIVWRVFDGKEAESEPQQDSTAALGVY